eukprot:6456708-Amphidinium_carterae.1
MWPERQNRDLLLPKHREGLVQKSDRNQYKVQQLLNSSNIYRSKAGTTTDSRPEEEQNLRNLTNKNATWICEGQKTPDAVCQYRTTTLPVVCFGRSEELTQLLCRSQQRHGNATSNTEDQHNLRIEREEEIASCSHILTFAVFLLQVFCLWVLVCMEETCLMEHMSHDIWKLAIELTAFALSYWCWKRPSFRIYQCLVGMYWEMTEITT